MEEQPYQACVPYLAACLQRGVGVQVHQKHQHWPEKQTSLLQGDLCCRLRALSSAPARAAARPGGDLPVQLRCQIGPRSHSVGTAALSQTYRIFLPVWGLFLFSINGILLPLRFLPSRLWYRPISFEV